LQTPTGTTQEHPHCGRTDAQLAGGLLASHLLKATEAENLGLPWRQESQGGPQAVGKLSRLGASGRLTFAAGNFAHVRVNNESLTLSGTRPQQIQRPSGSHAAE
jgi:hypothetical protein